MTSMKKLLVVAAIAVGITACADKDETPPELQESAVPTVGASSSTPPLLQTNSGR